MQQINSHSDHSFSLFSNILSVSTVKAGDAPTEITSVLAAMTSSPVKNWFVSE